MYNLLSQNIQYAKGIGPLRAKTLNDELEIFTMEDLIRFYPQKYIDRSTVYSISSLDENMQFIQLKGQIIDCEEVGTGRARRVEATFADGTGTVRLVWFNSLKTVLKALKLHTTYLLLGKPSLFNGNFNIAHPELDMIHDETADEQRIKGFRPIYRVTEKMRRNGFTSNILEKIIQETLQQIPVGNIVETLPDFLLKQYSLMGLDMAIRKIHRPDSLQQIPAIEYRLKFEELFYLQLNIFRYAHSRVTHFRGFRFNRIGSFFMRFYNEKLPFQLTEAQKRVIREIRKDLGSGRQMNRLLQGDVGSGKTIVAVMTMLIAIDNGYQASIVAPTEILAEQHFQAIQRMLSDLGVRIELLTSVVKGKRRQAVLEGLKDGSVHILVGTHAVMGDIVEFKNLGFAIIDEQHRFGVEQRSKLWQKNANPPHILVMTATPIPRTLAMTVYGDLDVSVIDELPPGRKPIKTLHVYDKAPQQLLGLVRSEITAGHQVYFVFPLIKENEKLDLKNLEKGYAEIADCFPDLKVGMLHGKMNNDLKTQVMQQFQRHELHILVSTTVIEVGVDVPNASVMVIENAERFGLAQLHQLRGRVGRGAEQSYCLLSTGYQLSENTRKRIDIMCESTDGFRIAEEDLKLRGPGDLEGTQQSGLVFNLRIAHLTRDSQLMETARNAAQRLINDDPEMNLPQNQLVWNQLRILYKNNVNWSVIS